jgi:hypothetical protein
MYCIQLFVQGVVVEVLNPASQFEHANKPLQETTVMSLVFFFVVFGVKFEVSSEEKSSESDSGRSFLALCMINQTFSEIC